MASSIWGVLADPLSGVGVIPFVDTDGVTITIDATNFIYMSGTDTRNSTGTYKPYQLTIGGGLRVGYQDTTATPGAATINKPAGRAKFAAAASSIVITNSYCTSTSMIRATLEASDATASYIKSIVPGTGSFTVTLNAACTAALPFSFDILNVF